MDTLGLIIETDIIKQVTLGDYTSYTMKIVDNDSLVFYNLTIEYKDGSSDMFITKYTPTEYWRNNKVEVFQGKVQSKKAELTQYTDPEEAFDELGGGLGNPDDYGGRGGGGGSVDDYFANYTPYYPTNCNGIVLISYEEVPFPCGCGDWDISECTGCPPENGFPMWPGVNEIPMYYCQENLDPGDYDPYDPGDISNPGGGGPDPTNVDDGPSVAATIKPEECTEHIAGDTNGDCVLSEHERCIKDNYPTEICDCVLQGSTIADCLDNDCEQLKAITDVPIINTRLYQLWTTNDNFEKGFKVSKNPSNNTYVPSDIISNNTNNCNAVKIKPNTYSAVIAHSHPSCVAYKMFSAEDILKLASMASAVQLNPNGDTTVQLTELTHIVVFNDIGYEGVFAIRFDNEESVQALQNIANNKKKRRDFIRDLKDAYKSDFDNNNGIENTSIAKQQEHMFKHLAKYNLNISLYEGILDDNNKVDNCKKINKDTLEQEDCN